MSFKSLQDQINERNQTDASVSLLRAGRLDMATLRDGAGTGKEVLRNAESSQHSCFAARERSLHDAVNDAMALQLRSVAALFDEGYTCGLNLHYILS